MYTDDDNDESLPVRSPCTAMSVRVGACAVLSETPGTIARNRRVMPEIVAAPSVLI